MAKVLIVDDEGIYRDQMELALALDGHEIQSVPNGRQAIDMGTRFRPDILVTDWMLKNHIHGLHVAEALRAYTPDLLSILITGFPSDDLRKDAAKTEVVDFIEKPFKRDRIRAAVRNAVGGGCVRPNHPVLGVLEVDSSGGIVFANPKAKELLSETEAGRDATKLADVFSPDEMPDLSAAIDQWVVAYPRCAASTVWQVRSQEQCQGGSRLVVVRRQDEPHHVGSAVIGTLLGVKLPRPVDWPFEGRVLVVEDDVLLRRLLVSVLESAGAGCYGAGTPAEAGRLLDADRGVQFVVHGYDMPKSSVASSIEELRAIRPGMVFVGTSKVNRRNEFAALGVDRYLERPWQINDLINVLRGNIGDCPEC